MFPIFCCQNLQPFRPTRTDHEAKFSSFFEWAKSIAFSCVVIPATNAEKSESIQESKWLYVIQLVKQVNYGPLESKRYFAPLDDGIEFKEISERDLIEANFAKVNSYKNFKCASHNKFFELNLYQKDPVNRHHWRANIARPAADIDLDAISSQQVSAQRTTSDDAKIEGRQPNTIQKNTGNGSKVPGAKPATDFDDSLIKVLAGIPKMGLEEAAESRDVLRDEDTSGDDEYRDDHGSGRDGLSDDETKDLDYTACSLECGYCGHCDY